MLLRNTPFRYWSWAQGESSSIEQLAAELDRLADPAILQSLRTASNKREQAIAARDEALRDRDKAASNHLQTLTSVATARDDAIDARKVALDERDRAFGQRDTAGQERDVFQTTEAQALR